MTDIAIDWAGEIRNLRRSKYLKQFALAEILGVDQATISRWERGDSVPDLRIQRRLLDLLRSPAADERALRHIVTVSLGNVVLSDHRRVMQAVSAGYSRQHGIPQDQMVGRCNEGKFGVEAEAIIGQVRQRGFYRGDVASATAVSRTPSLSGHRASVVVKVVWTPIRLADRILLRGERVELPESDYGRELARNGGPLRFVTMDELVQ